MKTYASIPDKKGTLFLLGEECLPPKNRWVWVMDGTYKALLKSENFRWAYSHGFDITTECEKKVPARSMTHWTLIRL